MRVSGRVFLSAVLVFASIFSAYQAPTASAAQLTNRSLTLQANGTTGGSTPGGVVNHQFQFTIPTTANIGSIRFEYCTTAADAPLDNCVIPPGLVTTAAAAGTQTNVSGFTINNTTAGVPYLTRTAASVTGGTVATLQLVGITNPTIPVSAGSNSFYVRISTHASSDATGPAIDTGSVAASVANQIQLEGVMPESLIFCTGRTIGFIATTTVPDCASATTGVIQFDRLFAPDDTAIATSQMAASTNAQYGYVITVHGSTLTSGGNTIAPMATAGNSTKGTAQFGMNLRANTAAASTPAVGSEIAQASDGVDYKGTAIGDYSIVDQFKFASGNIVADSSYVAAGPPTLGPTSGQVYTASYIVNVPGNQLPGTYTTTLTYICTPTF